MTLEKSTHDEYHWFSDFDFDETVEFQQWYDGEVLVLHDRQHLLHRRLVHGVLTKTAKNYIPILECDDDDVAYPFLHHGMLHHLKDGHAAVLQLSQTCHYCPP